MFSNYQKNRLFPNALPTLCKQNDTIIGSDFKFCPVNKCYDRLTDHSYVKFTESVPFNEISSEKFIDPSKYMIQTLNVSEKIANDKECVLDTCKSNKPGNIPSSKYTESKLT